MKKSLIALTLTLAAIPAVATAQNTPTAPKLTTLGDSISYLVGHVEAGYTISSLAAAPQPDHEILAASRQANQYLFSHDFSRLELDAFKRALELRTMLADMQAKGIDVDPAIYLSAYETMLSHPTGDRAALEADARLVNDLITRASDIVKQQEQARLDSTVQANEAAGAAYVDAQKRADKKILTTQSGLSYKRIKGGKGTLPTTADRVRVHYTGRLIDGTVFDSSVERGEPAEFGVTQVIPGWVEGLQMMTPGSKYTFYIPAKLAYGDRGAGEKIAPGATLVFDVELLEVIPQNKTEK